MAATSAMSPMSIEAIFAFSIGRNNAPLAMIDGTCRKYAGMNSPARRCVKAIPDASSLQGNRVKNSCCDEACEEVVIPSGDFAAEADGILAWGSSDQVEGHMLDGGEVGGWVIGADAAFVVAEIHVHDPVKAVLDHPMGSDS